MNEKKAYVEKAQAQLHEMEAQIDLLQAKAEGATADAKVEYLETVKDLRSRRREIEEKIDSLTVAGVDAWSELRQGISAAADDLTRALDKAKRQIGFEA
jgi:hypothetical protein